MYHARIEPSQLQSLRRPNQAQQRQKKYEQKIRRMRRRADGAGGCRREYQCALRYPFGQGEVPVGGGRWAAESWRGAQPRRLLLVDTLLGALMVHVQHGRDASDLQLAVGEVILGYLQLQFRVRGVQIAVANALGMIVSDVRGLRWLIIHHPGEVGRGRGIPRGALRLQGLSNFVAMLQPGDIGVMRWHLHDL